MAKNAFPPVLDMSVIDQQVMSGVVSHYKRVLEQVNEASQNFKRQVIKDMAALMLTVPGLKERIFVGDDFYELIDPEPDDVEPDGHTDILSPDG